MFLVIRILFVLLVLGFAFTGFKYLNTGNVFWLRYMRILFNITIAILLIFFTGLFIERLAGHIV